MYIQPSAIIIPTGGMFQDAQLDVWKSTDSTEHYVYCFSHI